MLPYAGAMGEEDRAAVAAFYADFARNWARGTSALYEDWAARIAEDPELVAAIAALPSRLRQPNLLFAAARWRGVPLEPFARVRSWWHEHWDAIVETASERSTQTNEPNRCATLLPVLSRIEGPVALLEVGASAGLCLYPDRYGYDYAAPSGTVRLDPPAGPSRVNLACRLDADASLPATFPEVVWRHGIDLGPIDPGDEESVDWLATLIWPGRDHDARVDRLRAAAAVAALDPAPTTRGDLREAVPDIAATAPADATLVVFHSAVLLYLELADRDRFAEHALGLSAALGRRVVWLSNETRGALTRVEAQLPADLDGGGHFVQTVDGVPVALAGQHGGTYLTKPFAGNAGPRHPKTARTPRGGSATC